MNTLRKNRSLGFFRARIRDYQQKNDLIMTINHANLLSDFTYHESIFFFRLGSVLKSCDPPKNCHYAINKQGEKKSLCDL